MNLLELIQPESTLVRFYVIDSQRPLELYNVYSQDQVIVVTREEDELADLPEYDTIYSSDMVSEWGGGGVCMGWVGGGSEDELADLPEYDTIYSSDMVSGEGGGGGVYGVGWGGGGGVRMS